MPSVQALKRAIQITEQIEKLQAELNQVLAGGGGKPAPTAAPKGAKPARRKGKMSAAGRAAIVAAQKARWAKIKAAKGSAETPSPTPKVKVRRKISAEARARMAAGAKARWAKAKA